MGSDIEEGCGLRMPYAENFDGKIGEELKSLQKDRKVRIVLKNFAATICGEF